MPLLQGQPFKLVNPLTNYPPQDEIFTIKHTGERFLNKKDYEDRLALYSQNIWTCQCTGKGCMTHQEAWTSETSSKIQAKAMVPAALHKPLLMLVHHSLSPLDQLVDAASILCHSQYHLGEELFHLKEKCDVRITNVKDAPRAFNMEMNGPSVGENNENKSDTTPNSLMNGTANGVPDDPLQINIKEEPAGKREMILRLYKVVRLDNSLEIDDVPTSDLLRRYKIPSKDQLRLFIRSFALRQRGTTCTPWVVSDELLKQHGIVNKLSTMFLSPKPPSPPKRKMSVPEEIPRKNKQPKLAPKPPVRETSFAQVFKKQQKETSFAQAFEKQISLPNLPNTTISKVPSSNFEKRSLMETMRPSAGPRPHHPGKPMSNMLHSMKVPKKRGRPRLTKEEKERNKRIRQATLFDLTGRMTGSTKILKIKTTSSAPLILPPTPEVLRPHPAGIPSPYKSPLKRADTTEALMKLPLMRRLVHEYRTIKGVMGQYRRMAYTMDLVLSKLTPEQIELIPDENLKNDLYGRQKKVEQKMLMMQMTPEERKEHMKKKARAVALERWKERKLKNLKIEDNTLKNLNPLPEPPLVSTPQGIDNTLFGDVVQITEFIKCYRELLLGEEQFKVTSFVLMDALAAGQAGYKLTADILCCLLPAIILDDTSKNCKELGMPVSTIPINYQTAPELARLCLKKYEPEEGSSLSSEECEQVGKEENELNDELLARMETIEIWRLEPSEQIYILKALVHKALGCSSLNAYMEEIDERVSTAFREKRIVLKRLAKEKEDSQKKKCGKKDPDKPKRQRGRPKGYSPKLGGTIKEFYEKMRQKEEDEKKKLLDTVLQRRKLSENSKKEKEEQEQLEKERQKQMEDENKKRSVEKKYDDLVSKRDNLLRKQPIGWDRYHNRYWIFHTTTPGLYVEKGWIDPHTNCQFIMSNSRKGEWTKPAVPVTPLARSVKIDNSEVKLELQENCESQNSVREELQENGHQVKAEKSDSDEEQPLVIRSEDEDERPLSIVKSKLKEDEVQAQLSIKSKIVLSPMKMAHRGRPPKEAYILVDEDTQTFPNVERNVWHCYSSMEEIKKLIDSLSDKGQRESQLLASITLNKDKLQYHYNLKPEKVTFMLDETSNRLHESLREDIVQIERELIEGWLGGISNFNEWAAKVNKSDTVKELGELLIEAQRNMQTKFLKGLLAPVKKQLPTESPEATPEFEEIEGPGVIKWREAVRSCATMSRLHVLVCLFDSSIKWERSMATRKCKVCRSKQREDPLLLCEKCGSSYHMYCLRPPFKGEVPDNWLCPTCVPKKIRRDDKEEKVAEVQEDPDELDDPTFSVSKAPRNTKVGPKKKYKKSLESQEKKVEHECCICSGRIGLIFCCKCNTPYHSECHEPPLQVRARKDWVCASCSNQYKTDNQDTDENSSATSSKRNSTDETEELVIKSKRATGPRDTTGRFVKKPKEFPPLPDIEELKKMQAIENERDERDDGDDELSSEADKVVRKSKARAMAVVFGHSGRRSGRNANKNTTYNETDEESDSDSDSSELEEGKEKEENNDTYSQEDGEEDLGLVDDVEDSVLHSEYDYGEQVDDDVDHNELSVYNEEEEKEQEEEFDDTIYSDDQMENSQYVSEEETFEN